MEKLYKIRDYSGAFVIDTVVGIRDGKYPELQETQFKILQDEIKNLPGYDKGNTLRDERHFNLLFNDVLILSVDNKILVSTSYSCIKEIKQELTTQEKREKIVEFMTWKNKKLYEVHQDLTLSIFNAPDKDEILRSFSDYEINECYSNLKTTEVEEDSCVCPWCIILSACEDCNFSKRYKECSELESLYSQIINKERDGFINTIGRDEILAKLKELFV